MSIRGSTLASLLLVIGVLNFGLFVVGSVVLGGDAVNGKIDDGQYYVGGKGQYVAVSRGVWIYSYVHVISVWITFPAAGIGALYLHTRHPHTKRGGPTTHDR